MYSENDFRYYTENSLTHYGIKGMRWGKHKAKRVARINKAFREAKAADNELNRATYRENVHRKDLAPVISRAASGKGYGTDKSGGLGQRYGSKNYIPDTPEQRKMEKAEYDAFVTENLNKARAKQQKDLADKQLLYSQQPFRKTMDQLSSKIKDVKKKLKDFFKIETKRNITGYVFSREEGRQVGELLKKRSSKK